MRQIFNRYLYRNYQAFSGFKFWVARHVTRTGWLVGYSAIVALLLGLDTTLSVGYQTFVFLFALLLTAFVATFFSRAHLRIERNLPRFGSAGEPLHYVMTVRNPGKRAQRGLAVLEQLPDPRPSFIEFIENREPGEEKRNWYDRTYGYYRWQWLISQNVRAVAEERALEVIPGLGKIEVPMQLLPLKRGQLHLDHVAIAIPDPFGLFRSYSKIKIPQTILILPKRYALPEIELPGTMKYQHGGVTLAAAVGESEEFVALRDYRAGDPLRHIHWKSWAKSGKPIVKEFQDEFFVRHALILDTFGDNIHDAAFEEAVSIAASFAYTIQDQDSLLDLMFVGPQAFCFTAGRGVGHTEQMLEILASVRVCKNKTFSSLHQLVLQHHDALSGSVCILLDWDQARKDFIEHLQILGLAVLVLVVVDGSKEIDPDLGPMKNHPESFHILRTEKIKEGLAAL